MAIRPATILPFLKGARPYALYVLFVLMIVFLLNQKDRFLLGVTGGVIAKELRFGDFACSPNINTSADVSANASCSRACLGIKSKQNCSEDRGVPCIWQHTALGIKYELLAGPIFTFIFTLAAIPLGILASNRWVNRRVAVSISLALWSSMTLATAFTRNYWEFLLTRLGLGLFESVCTPFATSIISDYFQEKHRGTALGVYNWGIYLGYSMAFAFEFVLHSQGWKWVFIIASLPGFVVALLILLTVREPPRKRQEQFVSVRGTSLVRKVLQAYLQPALILLCVGGGIRLGAGLVWAYNVKAYFDQLHCGEVDVGEYLSWVPIVGGTLGALFGGLVSDRLARVSGYRGRMWVLIISQIAAAPFLVGTLYLPPKPWAFLSLIPAYIIGETWLGICLTVAIELVPIEVSPASIALFLFISNNISSIMPLLLPVLKDVYGLQRTMLILFPGLYVISAGLFCVSLSLLIARDFCRKRDKVTSKSPGHVGGASRQRRRKRRRRRGGKSEASRLVQEDSDKELNIQGSDSDSDNSNSDDFVEIDEAEQNEAREALAAVAEATSPGGLRPIIIHPSMVSHGRDRGVRGRGASYGAVDMVGGGGGRPERGRRTRPASVIGSISNWSVLSPTVEERHWLAESQEGI